MGHTQLLRMTAKEIQGLLAVANATPMNHDTRARRRTMQSMMTRTAQLESNGHEVLQHAKMCSVRVSWRRSCERSVRKLPRLSCYERDAALTMAEECWVLQWCARALCDRQSTWTSLKLVQRPTERGTHFDGTATNVEVSLPERCGIC